MKKKSIDPQDVWNLLHEYIEAVKENDRQLKEQKKENDRQLKEQKKENDRQLKEQKKENDRIIKENDRQLKEQKKETDRQLKETDRQLKETDRRLDDKIDKTLKGIDGLKKYVGGIANSNGYVAEDLFFNSFSKNMTIGNMTFDSIDRNWRRNSKGIEDEFDIVLTNSKVLVIIEVKYNFHYNDVKTVCKKIDNFRILYPMYKNYTIFGGIAGLTMSNETIETAKKMGFFVFTQEGNKIKVLNDQVKEFSKT